MYFYCHTVVAMDRILKEYVIAINNNPSIIGRCTSTVILLWPWTGYYKGMLLPSTTIHQS
jgi:hypothetical protein